jgi:hypothetical protein
VVQAAPGCVVALGRRRQLNLALLQLQQQGGLVLAVTWAHHVPGQVLPLLHHLTTAVC